jgi:hypothetical protein
MSDLDSIVRNLASEREEVRKEAEENLRTASKSEALNVHDAVAMVRAACLPFPVPDRTYSASPNEWLLWTARDTAARHRDRSGPVLGAVAESFHKFTPRQRAAALQILTFVGGSQAALLYCDLLVKHRRGLEGAFLPTFEAKRGLNRLGPPPLDNESAAILFPAVLAAVEDGTAASIYLMLLRVLQAGLIPVSRIAEHEPLFLDRLSAEAERIRGLQDDSRPGHHNWKYDAPYAGHRDAMGVLLDLAGWWESPRVASALKHYNDFTDPWLRNFRAVSLLRLRERVEPGELEWIARSPRERHWLHIKLHEMGLGDALPDTCRDQAKLAEGHMVDWLCFGTELAREPDEIELVHVESRRRRNAWFRRPRFVDYYFFKYRVVEEHWSQADGWTVGMAGGYLRTAGGTTESDGSTFSKFQTWESKSLAEHVADYLS